MDAGRKQTDKAIFKLHKLVGAEYTKTTNGIRKPLTRYLKKHEKYRKWLLKELEAGRIKELEYRKRRLDDLMDEDFLLLLDDESDRMSKSTSYIWQKIKEAMPGVYAENYNWGVFRAEQETGEYITDLLTEEITRRLWAKNKNLIKMPGKAGKLKTRQAETVEKQWQKEVLRTAISIIAGLKFPIDRLVEEIIDWIRRRNISTGKEYVTTTATGTENKGRNDAFTEAQEKVDHTLVRGWVAVMDDRTRVAHRQLDGTWVGMEEPWVYKGDKIWFPGDPSAPAYLVRNCRCTIDIREKQDADGSTHKNKRYKGMSYEEWKAAKPRRVK